MKRLSLISLALITVSLAFLCVRQTALAFSVNTPCTSATSTSAYCNDTAGGGTNKISGSNGIILTAVNIISYIAGIAAVIIIIVAGLRFVISGGDANNVSGARNAIIFSLVGIAIIASAQLIIRFILGKL